MRAMFTCVFWNTNGHDRTGLVGQLCAQAKADVVILAEPGVDPESVAAEMRRSVDQTYFQPHSDTRRLHLFARHPAFALREIYGHLGGRATIRLLHFDGTDFLLAAVHLPSKLYFDPGDQTAEAQVIADQIRRIEEEHDHRRTIVVGDFNMNPFEAGIAQTTGFHAMMTRSSVKDSSRTVQGRDYPFFYNPMWGFFGDRTQGPPGTYHYRNTGHLSYDWNIFDQILIRPDALPWFAGDVEIVSKIGEVDLLGVNGHPDAEVGSDHLPILFRLTAAE